MRIHILRKLTQFAFAIACALPLMARATDYTDIWWAGHAEDGWGVNLVQSEDFIFATFFVYGPAPGTQPIWYAGNLTRNAAGAFSGGLYQTTGTGFGVPWDPAQHSSTAVGTATFTPTSTTTGTLAYNVGTTNVTKQIERQTLKLILLGGNYAGTSVVEVSGCTNTASNVTRTYIFDPQVTQSLSGSLQFDFQFSANESCTMVGTAAQEGQLFRIPSARYTCNSGIDTTSTLYEIKATAIGIEGRWQANTGGGCREDGRFSAVLL